jgi:hypothetical protein
VNQKLEKDAVAEAVTENMYDWRVFPLRSAALEVVEMGDAEQAPDAQVELLRSAQCRVTTLLLLITEGPKICKSAGYKSERVVLFVFPNARLQ